MTAERKLENKVALITGGTSGIGEAIARLFVEEGAEVVIVGRDSKKGEAVAESINYECQNKSTSETKCQFLQSDCSVLEQVRKLKESFLEKYQKLDILINNAGVLKTSPLEQLCENNAEDWHENFRVNLDSVMYMTSTFLDMLLNSHGSIITNASIDGLLSLTRGRQSYAYPASKAAVIKFMRQCALNYTPRGIRVNTLCPGLTKTSLFTNQDYSRFLGAIPMGRVADANEIAKAALFLASDDASYISGSELVVDGGANLL